MSLVNNFSCQSTIKVLLIAHAHAVFIHVLQHFTSTAFYHLSYNSGELCKYTFQRVDILV